MKKKNSYYLHVLGSPISRKLSKRASDLGVQKILSKSPMYLLVYDYYWRISCIRVDQTIRVPLKMNGKRFGTHCGEHTDASLCRVCESAFILYTTKIHFSTSMFTGTLFASLSSRTNSPNLRPPTAEKRRLMTQTQFNCLWDERFHQPHDPQKLRRWRVILRNWILLLPVFGFRA